MFRRVRLKTSTLGSTHLLHHGSGPSCWVRSHYKGWPHRDKRPTPASASVSRRVGWGECPSPWRSSGDRSRPQHTKVLGPAPISAYEIRVRIWSMIVAEVAPSVAFMMNSSPSSFGYRTASIS